MIELFVVFLSLIALGYWYLLRANKTNCSLTRNLGYGLFCIGLIGLYFTNQVFQDMLILIQIYELLELMFPVVPKGSNILTI